MIFVNAIPIIFEGNPRLVWARSSEALCAPGLSHAAVLARVWPDDRTRTLVRRRISMLGRTVVVFDGRAAAHCVHPSRVVPIPDGAIVERIDDETCRVMADPLNWLPERHRQRGLAFRRSAAQVARLPRARDTEPILIEDELIGSREPLRFAFRFGPVGLVELRDAVDRMFRPESVSPALTGVHGLRADRAA